jgi:FtsP/CotA-like multicopper oxidase with cupredoxin domain
MMASFNLSLLLSCLLLSAVWAAKVKETLRFTWAEGAPNGQSRELIYTNGQFPGPPLIFTEGDHVEVCPSPYLPFLISNLTIPQITVINDMPRNITVHWHGLS